MSAPAAGQFPLRSKGEFEILAVIDAEWTVVKHHPPWMGRSMVERTAPRQSVFAWASLQLRRTRSVLRSPRGCCATRSPKGEAWWARQFTTKPLMSTAYKKVVTKNAH
jgi:hypothetical protein